MVMIFSGDLVQRTASGDFDDRKPPVVEQRPDRPIDGRHAKAVAHGGGFRVHFVRRKRPAGAFESRTNRSLLPGVPFRWPGHVVRIREAVALPCRLASRSGG